MIRLESVSKQHGGRILFLDASMAVFRGEKIGLVGPNGAGKSTIFRMIVGEEEPDSGSVLVEKRISIGYFSQSVGEMGGRSVLEETIAGAGEVATVAHELHELELAHGRPRARRRARHAWWRASARCRPASTTSTATASSRAPARSSPASASRPRSSSATSASSRAAGRCATALARILLMKPDALLLDEPTNHLDIESILWLEEFLRDFEGALIMTSHDREFMNRIVTKIVEIDGGELTTYTGDYDFYEQQRAIGAQQAEAQYARQQAMLAKEEAFIARFKARASHAAQVQSRVKKLDKIEKVEPPRRRRVVQFEFPQPPRSGDDVVKLARRRQGLRGERRVYDGFDFVIRRRERWCVMGVNGAGKSTLLKLIAGESQPDAGTVDARRQRQARLLRAARDGPARSRRAPCIETLEIAHPRASIGVAPHGRRRLRLLRATTSTKSCRILSGGERARLVLADHALRSAELPRARRADQPPRPRDQGHADAAPSPTSTAR